MDFERSLMVSAILIGLVALVLVLHFKMRRNLQSLKNRYGGQISSYLSGSKYTFDGIEVRYSPGTGGVSLPNTRVKVLKTPRRPIEIALYPRAGLFKYSGERKFENLYVYKYSTKNNIDILPNRMKSFLAENVSQYISLYINVNEFYLKTRSSPLNIHNIENCIDFMLELRDVIKEYEVNKH